MKRHLALKPHSFRRYHSLNDQVNTLTRRSGSSATTADGEEGQAGVDEHGRRTGLAAIDGSYGTSSAVRNTSLARTPVRMGMVEPEELDLETTPLAGTSDPTSTSTSAPCAAIAFFHGDTFELDPAEQVFSDRGVDIFLVRS
jgi:hypothetical protein